MVYYNKWQPATDNQERRMGTKTPGFKLKQKVTFTTHHGRKGAGTIVDVNETPQGVWYSVKDADGKTTKLRENQLQKA